MIYFSQSQLLLAKTNEDRTTCRKAPLDSRSIIFLFFSLTIDRSSKKSSAIMHIAYIILAFIGLGSVLGNLNTPVTFMGTHDHLWASMGTYDHQLGTHDHLMGTDDHLMGTHDLPETWAEFQIRINKLRSRRRRATNQTEGRFYVVKQPDSR